jgi:hypothetical protein
MRISLWVTISIAAFFIVHPHNVFAVDDPVRAPSVFSSNKRFFTIQVSTLLKKFDALSFTQHLKERGFHAYFTEKHTENGKTLYKIRIGEYETKAAAEKAAFIFFKKEHLPYIIVMSGGTAELPEHTGQAALTVSDNESTKSKNSLTTKLFSPAFAEPANIDRTWPKTVKKIFAYQKPNGTLSFTNKYSTIPEEFRSKIEYISVFPVGFLSQGSNRSRFLFNVDDEKKEIELSGVYLGSQTAAHLAYSYFKEKLNGVPLRLKYNPRKTGQPPVIPGRLFLKNGTCVNLEMIRKGIGSCSLEDIEPVQWEAYILAESYAKKEKSGIWGEH